ncbi:MAG: hypothetical protein UX04_C0007G0007 [Microgenomates group bacterium GW2011_GWF2_45_18]|nr:MAG: hypothetical protein UW18_C0002G0102 [Microgenomates group bacterium GW2011_GWF1_44_10]KKU01418.1 MAG: hypothetical protein UX04_C0007G0007 [Microgenomates group bacterium GW2011_GWF2_45_18]OGJ41496.1 MAG: hypothetical protein A2378_00425 [Candidatus Pacebacteria bacterium RIFOXYB1_FULL_44_10]HAU98866.1 hypothetical protein [Candidatus Paceibacterota bacterium]HAX01176.1 hypothetical protein [Candidatus Paceibacterota bacterium]
MAKNIQLKLISDFNGVIFDMGAGALRADLVELYQKIADHHEIFLFTEGTNYQLANVYETVTELFDKVYESTDIGYLKNDPEAYRWIASDLNVQTGDLVFVDDSIERVEAAKMAGAQVFHVTSIDALKEFLEHLFIENSDEKSE